MLLTEYNEAEAMELFKEDGRKEGRIVGREEGRIEGREEGHMAAMLTSIQKVMKNMNLTAEQAMDVLDIPMSDRIGFMKKL